MCWRSRPFLTGNLHITPPLWSLLFDCYNRGNRNSSGWRRRVSRFLHVIFSDRVFPLLSPQWARCVRHVSEVPQGVLDVELMSFTMYSTALQFFLDEV